MKLDDMILSGYTDKTHDEVLDELEKRFENQETERETPYYKMDGKEHSDHKGEIDLMVSFDDVTFFYEVKPDATYSNMKKAQEQLDRMRETFEGQSENVGYRMKLGEEEIDYTPFIDDSLMRYHFDFEEDVL